MRAVSRVVSPSAVVVAEIIGVAVGGVAAVLGTPPGAAIGAGILIALGCLIPVRGRPIIAWPSLAIRAASDRDREVPRPVDVADGLGISWSGFECAAVIELVPHPALTFLSRRGAVPDAPLPLARIAASLSQHDIHLSGLDVISYSRTVQTRAASVLRQLVGPLPAVPNRTVRIVLRLDAGAGSGLRRGGGRTGGVAALRTATQRLAHLLAAQGLPTRLLGAAEIDAAVSEIDDRDSVGFIAKELSLHIFDRVATASAQATTTMVSLRPAENADHIAMAMSWRLTAAAKRPSIDSRRADGRQLDHLFAHLPLAGPEATSLLYREIPISNLDEFELPAAGCGQLVGATAAGQAVAIDLCRASTAWVSGSPLFLRQTVFRAVATGARIVVRTDRREVWMHLADAIGTPSQLLVVGLEAHVSSGYNAVVSDGDVPDPYPGVTTIYAASDPALVTGIGAEVSLIQAGNTITVTAGRRTVDVELVTLPTEREFIAGLGGAESSGVRVR